jgi:hypothetical protein
LTQAVSLKNQIKSYILSKINHYGYDLILSSKFKKVSIHIDEPASLLFQVDPIFQSKYQQGCEVTNTPSSTSFICSKRESRFYNLLSLHRWNRSQNIPGWQVECGCWKGLSSFMLNSQLKDLNPEHDGSGFMIIDSFAGLSNPTKEDSSDVAIRPQLFGTNKFSAPAGSFSCHETEVRNSLSDFPQIEFYNGWIPEVLNTLPERTYSFVHIDLDLHDPILGGINYFLPRMESGGLLLLDDYGSLSWPGAKKAGDDGANNYNQVLTPLSTGQALLIKR